MSTGPKGFGDGASQTGKGAGVANETVSLADIAFGGFEFLVVHVAHDYVAGGVT